MSIDGKTSILIITEVTGMEQWKDIKGYEDYYEVSNLGNVRSKVSGELLKPFSGSRKYLSVDLGYAEKPKRVTVHKLVMETFNPEGYFEGAEVDHIDGDKTNNKLSNLEWVTHDENMRRWAVRNGETIIAISPTGEHLEFATQSDICRKYKELDFRHVSACLKGKLAQHKGWKFYYKSEGKPRKAVGNKKGKTKKCIGISPEGTTYEFMNQSRFADEHGLSRKQINACLNGSSGSHKGWTFFFAR